MLKFNFNSFLLGLAIGLALPILFSWIFISRFYPAQTSYFQTIQILFPSILLGKLLLLSIIPNMVGIFVFYKKDYFKAGIGVMIGAMPYLFTALMIM